MKFFVVNNFLYSTTINMLNERFNSSSNRYDNYCMVMEPGCIGYIDSIKASGMKVIFYDLEHIDKAYYRHSDGTIWYDGDLSNTVKFTDVLKEMYDSGKIDEIWTYTIENKDYYKSIGMEYVKYCPYLYTKCLEFQTQPSRNKLIDVLFYGNFTDYRIKTLMKPLHDCGVKLVVAHAFKGQELNAMLASSKIVLDCRQTEFDGFNQNIVRQFYPVINSCCVLAQKSKNDNYMGDSVVYFNDETDVAQKCNQLLMNDTWFDVAMNAKYKYAEISKKDDLWHKSDIKL